MCCCCCALLRSSHIHRRKILKYLDWFTTRTFPRHGTLGHIESVRIATRNSNLEFSNQSKIHGTNEQRQCVAHDRALQEYTIDIQLDDIHWQVKKRYSEFADFHEQLIKQIPSIDAKSLPPKKLLNNNSLDFLHRRRLALDHYLKYLFQFFTSNSMPLPECFVKFLDFHLYVRDHERCEPTEM